MLVGGGTGGHILPLLAVARKLKEKDSSVHIVVVIDKSTKFAQSLESSRHVDSVQRVSAGKLRRYPNQSFVASMLDVRTNLLNIRDLFRTLFGIFQAIRLLGKARPAIIFIKGGFVGVPVGIAARLKGVQFITHDSDASPGLANRIIGRWATLHAVGMPVDLYSYPKSKTRHVGIPVASDFRFVTKELQDKYRKQLGVPLNSKMVFVTGGSQGAQQLNVIMFKIAKELTTARDVYVVHQAGNSVSAQAVPNSSRYKVLSYIDDLYLYSGAADVIISRAGSAVAEFATQGKAVIVVPAPHLASGHQLKNANVLQTAKAAIILSEDQLMKEPEKLLDATLDLLKDNNLRQELGGKLSGLYSSGAASKIAGILLDLSKADS